MRMAAMTPARATDAVPSTHTHRQTVRHTDRQTDRVE